MHVSSRYSVKHSRGANLDVCDLHPGGAESLSMKTQPARDTSRKNRGPQTTAIHGGEPKRHGVGAPVGTPICRTSTFTCSSTEEMRLWAEGKSKAYIYTRYGKPTLTVDEVKISSLEEA